LVEAGRALARDPVALQEIDAALARQPAFFVAADALDRTLEALHQLTEYAKLGADSAAITAEGLKNAKSAFPEYVDGLLKAHDFLMAARQDIADAGTGIYTLLSSHTLEESFRLGLDFLLDEDRFSDLVKNGKLGEAFARRIGYFSFGADDVAAAIGQLIGGHGLDDPEAITRLFNGFNKSAWGAVGLLASGGNRMVGDTFAALADHAAAGVRELSLPWFVRKYSEAKGIDGALLSPYAAAQQARQAHGQPLQSIEEFYGHDRSILRVLTEQQRRDADGRFGLQLGRMQPAPMVVSTRTTYESYNEVCRAGICVRTDLSKPGAAPMTPPPSPLSPPARDLAPQMSREPATTGSTAARPEHDPVAPIGGIRIDAATWLSEPLPPLRAVVVDPLTDTVVLVGDDNRTGDLKRSDFLVALAVVNGRPSNEITFSLDPADPSNPRGKWLKALYRPEWLAAKSAGTILFDSDLLLKAYGYQITIGADGKIVPRVIKLPGYRSYADLVVETTKGAALAPQWTRFWLVVDKAELHATPNAILVKVAMAVKARRQVVDPKSRTGLSDLETDPNGPEAQWASLMTAHLKDFDEPAWRRLEELAKAVAFCKWLRSEGLTVDLGLIARLVNQEQSRNVDKITALDIVRRSERREPLENGRGERLIRSELHLFGGVDLGFEPRRIPDNGEAHSIADSVLQVLRDNPTMTVFTIKPGAETLRAVVMPILTRVSSTVTLAPRR
jgi:hypothetical protein